MNMSLARSILLKWNELLKEALDSFFNSSVIMGGKFLAQLPIQDLEVELLKKMLFRKVRRANK